jgi:hypothetical protein
MKCYLERVFMGAVLAATCLPSHAATITSVVLTGPSTIYCCEGIGGSANYTLTINVTGTTQPSDAFWQWGIFDEDTWLDPDDTLIGYQPITIENQLGPGDTFSMVRNFTLNCDANCNITGSGGTSGENTAEVFGYLIGVGGGPVKSNVLSVTCLAVPTPCPEAATVLPGFLFLTGCSLVRRRGKRQR